MKGLNTRDGVAARAREIEKRLDAVQQRLKALAERPKVLVVPPGESIEQAIELARKEGAAGPLLIVTTDEETTGDETQ